MPLGGTTLFQYKSMKNAFQCKPENLEIRNGQPCCATASEAGRESGPPEGVLVYAWGQYGRPPVPRRWSGLAVQQEHSPVRGPPAARQRGLQDRVTRHSVVVGRGSPPPPMCLRGVPKACPFSHSCRCRGACARPCTVLGAVSDGARRGQRRGDGGHGGHADGGGLRQRGPRVQAIRAVHRAQLQTASEADGVPRPSARALRALGGSTCGRRWDRRLGGGSPRGRGAAPYLCPGPCPPPPQLAKHRWRPLDTPRPTILLHHQHLLGWGGVGWGGVGWGGVAWGGRAIASHIISSRCCKHHVPVSHKYVL